MRPLVVLSILAMLAATSCGGRASPAVDDGGVPASDAGVPNMGSDQRGGLVPGSCTREWRCAKDAAGRILCSSEGGLPPGGASWQCHLAVIRNESVWDSEELRWICVGPASFAGVLPGGCGWACRQLSTPALYRCEKPDGDEDRPPTSVSSYWCKRAKDATCFTCAKGSALGGTHCEQLDDGSTKESCVVGERIWCDGLQYGPWGQAACDPATGRWKTKVVNGQPVLDCQELASGERPATVCACYHFYFNPACCERLDCRVPVGSKGQICPPSPGGLCDYCNPLNAECVEPGAHCIVTNAHETFCGRSCSASDPCPAGYTCVDVKLQTGTVKQCVPADLSCYY